MGLFDKFKSMIVDPEDDDYSDYDSDEEMISRPDERREVPPSETRRGNKVVNIHATAQLQVVLVKPERFDDSSSIADHLNAKRTVVLNLESASKEVSRRILDFLSGVAYANEGQIKKVANCTYIIIPYNVGIMGDLLDELENNGLYF